MEQQKIVCQQCSATESILWIKCPREKKSQSPQTYICNICYAANELKKKKKVEEAVVNKVEIKQEPKVAIRKSARIKRIKSFSSTPRTPKVFVPKQINYKAPDPVLIPTESEEILCNNHKFRRGDIVSFEEGGKKLYCQLRGFLTDQYCAKSTVITWLLPKIGVDPSADGSFHPDKYRIGFEEDTPRPLNRMTYVMHAPSMFYMKKTHAYAPKCGNPFQSGYVPDMFKNTDDTPDQM